MENVVLENITKKFGNKTLFDNYSLHIEEGDFVSIMGASGSGKTTLLNIIGMLEPPDEGKVTIYGRNTPRFNSKDARILRRERISYLFQNYGLIDNETVEFNLSVSAAFKKTDKKKRQALFSQALNQVGLAGYEKRKVYTLSGGEQQRVAMAKIIIKNPSIILADEPTGSLDQENRDYILQLLKNFNEEGKTVVVVTHDPVVELCAKKHIRL